MTVTSSYIAAISSAGTLTGFQLRVNGGGPGNTKFFAAKKHGGPLKARLAAEQMSWPSPSTGAIERGDASSEAQFRPAVSTAKRAPTVRPVYPACGIARRSSAKAIEATWCRASLPRCTRFQGSTMSGRAVHEAECFR